MDNEFRTTRFHQKTGVINLKRLQHETDRVLVLGFVMSALVHMALFATIRFEQTEVKVQKPIQTHLIIRPPRMTRPLVINRPDTVKRELRRQFTQRFPTGKFQFKSLPTPEEVVKLSKSLAERYDSVLKPDEVRQIIADILNDIDAHYRETVLDSIDIKLRGEELNEYLAAIEREVENMFSMKESLLTVDDLDTGQYRGLVIKNFEDKTKVEGFVYIPASIWGTELGQEQQQSDGLVPPDTGKRAVIGLANGFTIFTGIKVKVDRQLYIDRQSLLAYPVVYISADNQFQLSPLEQKNLAAYLTSGGFVMLEPYSINGLQSIRKMILDSLGGKAVFKMLPLDHPILHSFFDFESRPMPISPETMEDPKDVFYLEGLFIGEELVGLLMDGHYGTAWAAEQYDNPFFRIAINGVTYALIRQGSVAKQYINADTGQ
jgi:hypothetical protein